MNKTIFIGGMWTKEDSEYIYSNSKSNIQNAANEFQWNIIRGLEENINSTILLISGLFVGAYPKYKIYIHKKRFSHNDSNNQDYQINFLNLPLIKHFSKTIHTIEVLKKYIENDELNIVGYSMNLFVVNALAYAKKRNTNINTCLIITDLPEYKNLGKKQNLIFNAINIIINKILYKRIEKIDSFVLLTDEMKNKINIKNRKYEIIEGISSINKYANNDDCDKKEIVYTGTLDEKYGVCDLVNEFMKIKDKSISLIICGYGDSEDYIIDKAKKDKRIIFKGLLPHEEILAIQSEAFLLINPRSPHEEYTKYSFPSKLLEYLSAGKPVMSYKLDGIPKEYDDYLIYIRNSISEEIEKFIRIDRKEWKEICYRNRKFVEENKNAYNQTKKLVKLLK